MKNLFLLLLLFSSVIGFSQVNYTANDQVTPYTGTFLPGINFDYYPPYSDFDLANIASGNAALGISGIGAHTSRPALRESFTEVWGYDSHIAAFQHFQNVGMNDLTCIVGFPAEWHRDHTVYCSDGVTESQMFQNLYTPIWDGGANGTPYNDDNYLAAYMYKLVTNYQGSVKFWEIWNEPGFDHSFVQGWQPPGGPGNWWDNDPSPCVNHFKAPIQHFVRTLRICYDVIKTVDPDAYVTLAGVGFESFLDAVLRNTDNPNGGGVTAEYPYGGGAYFDVMGFHTYPDIDGSVREWDSNLGQWVYHRNSDAGAQGIVTRKTVYTNRLAQYGYDGITHPKKEWIITELNTPRVKFGANSMASIESQTNYITKAYVVATRNDIRQMHPYQLADRTTAADAVSEFDLLGMYQNFTNTQPYTNLIKTDEGIAYKTTSDILYRSDYDAAKTAAMNLPNNLDGAAYYDATNNRYKYVLWAKTTLDLSEAASGTYSFPASFGLTTLNKRMWNYSETNAGQDISVNNIALTGRPIFLVEGQDPGNGDLTFNCPANITETLPAGTGNMNVSWTEPTATTTCPASSLTSVTQTDGLANGSSFWTGTHTITYGASDQCGNTTSCSFTVTLVSASQGGIALACPNDITVTAQNGNATVTWITPSATTTCPTNATATVTQTAGAVSGSSFAVGTHTITYTATDMCGNTTSCSFTITVENGQSTVSFTTCPSNAAATAAPGMTANVSWTEPTATSTGCNNNTVTIAQTTGGTNGSGFAIGTHTITYSATNSCGASATCSFDVVVTESSVSSCSDIAGFTKIGELNGHGYYESNTAFTWQNAKDLATSSGGYIVSINDAAENEFIKSHITQSVFIGINDEANEGNLVWQNGDTITYTNYSTSCSWCNANGPDYDFGEMLPWDGSWVFSSQWNSRAFVMEMACNSVGTGDLTITCPTDINVTTAANIEIITWNPATATTTCSTNSNTVIAQTLGLPSGSSFSIGTHTITYEATDMCNNTASCSFTVTVATQSSGGTCDPITGFTKLGELNGHGYYISNNTMTWMDAQVLAAQHGNMVAINSQEENDFVQGMIDGSVFIGLSDVNTEGVNTWDGGDSITYTNYTTCDWCGPNTEVNDFGVMLPWDGTWAYNNQWVYRQFILETSCGNGGGGGGGGSTCPSTIAGFTTLGDLGGHKYYMSDMPYTWDNAKTDAESNGGYLASIATQEENDFVRDNLNNTMVFIGYNDANTEGSPEWVSGEAISLDLGYNNSAINDFAVMNFWAGSWQMVNQWVAKPYILEMNCNGSVLLPLPMAVETIEYMTLVSVHPNPVNDFITARISSNRAEDVQLVIFNPQGQIQTTKSSSIVPGSNEINFEIQNLIQGVYFLRVKGEHINKTVQFIKID